MIFYLSYYVICIFKDTVDSSLRMKEQHSKSKLEKGKIDPWSHRKAGILQKYTTSEKLSMVTSFLLEGEKGLLMLLKVSS